MLKGLTELCWDVVSRVLSQTMNFLSDKALLCCKNVSDQQEGWRLLTIAQGLLVPFVREELSRYLPLQPDLSPVNFAGRGRFSWCSQDYVGGTGRDSELLTEDNRGFDTSGFWCGAIATEIRHHRIAERCKVQSAERRRELGDCWQWSPR